MSENKKSPLSIAARCGQTLALLPVRRSSSCGLLLKSRNWWHRGYELEMQLIELSRSLVPDALATPTLAKVADVRLRKASLFSDLLLIKAGAPDVFEKLLDIHVRDYRRSVSCCQYGVPLFTPVRSIIRVASSS